MEPIMNFNKLLSITHKQNHKASIEHPPRRLTSSCLLEYGSAISSLSSAISTGCENLEQAIKILQQQNGDTAIIPRKILEEKNPENSPLTNGSR